MWSFVRPHSQIHLKLNKERRKSLETDYNFSFKEERAQYIIEKLLLLIFEPLFSITSIEREDYHVHSTKCEGF
jgi:secreted Zn-dependent insulinase-like peptidase